MLDGALRRARTDDQLAALGCDIRALSQAYRDLARPRSGGRVASSSAARTPPNAALVNAGPSHVLPVAERYAREGSPPRKTFKFPFFAIDGYRIDFSMLSRRTALIERCIQIAFGFLSLFGRSCIVENECGAQPEWRNSGPRTPFDDPSKMFHAHRAGADRFPLQGRFVQKPAVKSRAAADPIQHPGTPRIPGFSRLIPANPA